MKERKEEVNYKKSGDPDRSCFKCRHASFWGCNSIVGKVDPDACCDKFREPEAIENARGIDALENM